MPKTALRIIFMGTPLFAVPALQALLDNKENIVAVVTQPDRPKGRGRKLAPPPVKELAAQHDIPVIQPTKVRTEEFLDNLRYYSPDLIIVAAYGRILTQEVLDLPTYGAINVHGSLLPKYRGAAPVQWAILNGEKETGITIMQMDAGLDTGDMLLPGTLTIEDNDTSSTLAPKMSELGGRLLITALEKFKNNDLPPQSQDDSLATFAPPLTKEQGEINWENSAFSISCQIRALDPWPTAFTYLSGTRVRLFKPSVINENSSQTPGTIIRADKKGLIIACGSDLLHILEVQKDGSKRMPIASFLCGNTINTGDKFGS